MTIPTHDQVISSADGTEIAIRRIGSGHPVVMAHGSGGGLHSWATVADLLADEYELWLMARRGYGPSGVPATAKTFAGETADVLAVADAAGAPVHLVGASYGANLALHTAAAAPARLRSLALFEPPLFAAGPHVGPLLRRYRTAFGQGDHATATAVLNELTRVPASVVATLVAAAGGREPDPAEAHRSGIGWLHDLEALAADTGDIGRWSSISVPTLVMRGAETWEPMPSTMNALVGVIPGVREVIWEGQSHFATMTAPALVADTLREFFRSTTPTVRV